MMTPEQKEICLKAGFQWDETFGRWHTQDWILGQPFLEKVLQEVDPLELPRYVLDSTTSQEFLFRCVTEYLVQDFIDIHGESSLWHPAMLEQNT